MSVNDTELIETQSILEQLAQYSRTYYTRDYQDFTSEWVGEILAELKPAPYTDSRAFAPPSDPFATLFKIENIERLKPYDEVMSMDKDTKSLLKKAMTPKVPTEMLRTERAANNAEAYGPSEAASLDLDFVLTARSRKHLASLGKSMYRRKLPSRVGALTTKHIPNSVAVEEVHTPLPVDKILCTEYCCKEREEVAAVIEPLFRLHKVPVKLDDQAYISRFDLSPHGDTDIPDTRFMTMFPRSRRPGHLCAQDSKVKVDPHNMAALPEMIADIKPPSSDDSISRQNMRVVDGWEPPLFPRSRRIGGRDGIRPHILKDQTINSFLISVLPTFPAPEIKTEPLDAITSSPNPATSMVGNASIKGEIVDPSLDDGVDADIEHLCSQAASFAANLEDRIEDKTLEMMEVPSLPEPTEHQRHSWIPTTCTELVTPCSATNPEIPRVCVRKAPGKHSVSLALSWAMFTVTEQLPPLTEILDVATPLDPTRPELLPSTLKEMEQLFEKYGIPGADDSSVEEPLGSPKPYLAILEGRNDVPLVDNPLNQNTLLLSRLERHWAQRKRKNEDMDDVEEEAPPAVAERADSKPYHGARKRMRTVSPSPPPLPKACDDAGALEGRHDVAITAAVDAQLDVFSDEGKENWDPSFYDSNDPGPINPHLDELAAFEQAHHHLDQTSHTFVAQDDYDMDSQLVIEDFGDEPVYEAFDPLLTETQPYLPPAAASAPPSPHSSPPKHHENDAAVDAASKIVSQEPHLSFDALQGKGLFSHSMGISEFARLRSVKVSEPQQDQHEDTNVDMASTTTPLDSSSAVQTVNTGSEPQTAPPDLVDKNTLTLDNVDTISPPTVHYYMASVDVLQKRALVKSLNSSDCLVGLVERATLGGVHLIVDCSTAIMFVPLLALPSESSAWIERIAVQSWKYSWIHIIFEAYPESCSLKSHAKASELYAYTPPILKAVKKFRRDISISEACSSKSSGCLVTYSFADSVLDAARLVRHVGNLAEERDITGGAIWGDRQWLENEHEDECDLENVAGLNQFSSALILSQVSVEDLLSMSSQARFDHFGPYLGENILAAVNEDIESRYERSREAYQIGSSFDEPLYDAGVDA